MNLGLGIETALNPAGGVDGGGTAGAPGAAAAGKTHPAAAVFGQLMAKALQQQATAQGQAGGEPQAATTGDQPEATLLAMLGASPDSEPSEGEGPQGANTPASPDAAALGLPVWMPALHGLPAVQQITVGPSLQAITGASPAPDAHSLTAFARQQGLDTAAIAWLMNPSARGGSDLPLPGAGLPTSAALAVPQTTPAGASAADLLSAGLLSGAPLQATAPLPTAAAPGAGSLAAALASAGLPAEWAPGLAQSGMAGQVANAAAVAAIATGSATAPGSWSPTTGLPTGLDMGTPDSPLTLGHPGSDLSPLRWSQAIAAAQANPQNPSGANVNLPATSTVWAEIALDLSSDGGGSDASDEPADQANPGGLAAQAAPSPLAGDGQGLHKSQALAFQARLAAQPGLASNLGLGSDQMQQLSEKMADAIGERMLRELEKGEMNLRLSLKPAHLGHIEVEMRLRAGELDATFAAPQAATRELLQDGLARLRDSLAQAGMDVATLNVKNGQNRQNGGDSTAGQRKFTPKDNGSDPTDNTVASVESAPRPRRSDGWDVMV